MPFSGWKQCDSPPRLTDRIGSRIKSALRLMEADSSRLGYRLLQVLSASFAICKALDKVIRGTTYPVLVAREQKSKEITSNE